MTMNKEDNTVTADIIQLLGIILRKYFLKDLFTLLYHGNTIVSSISQIFTCERSIHQWRWQPTKLRQPMDSSHHVACRPS